MLRARQEILDPSPLDVGPVWDHFESRCAYCDLPLDIAGRSAHIDHAEAAGATIRQPRPPACGTCNGDDKREMPGRAFVASKAATDTTLRREWPASRPGRSCIREPTSPPPPEVVRTANETAARERVCTQVCRAPRCDEVLTRRCDPRYVDTKQAHRYGTLTVMRRAGMKTCRGHARPCAAAPIPHPWNPTPDADKTRCSGVPDMRVRIAGHTVSAIARLKPVGSGVRLVPSPERAASRDPRLGRDAGH